MARYSLISSTASCENGSAPCYGIKGDNFEIHDVSFDRSRMQSEIDSYNELGLAPEHVYDAVNNFLAVEYS